MLIIERIEVVNNLSKTEADLFHDLNQLVDAINGYHLQHTKWLEDDYLEDQRYLPPAQYSDKKIVSLFIKRQAAERQRAIAIASNRKSDLHIAFFNPIRDAISKRLGVLNTAIGEARDALELLSQQREALAIKYAGHDSESKKATKKKLRLEQKLALDKNDIELIYLLKQAEKKCKQTEANFIESKSQHQATLTVIATLTDQLAEYEGEVTKLARKLTQIETTTADLESDVQPYLGTLHLSAVELAVVAKLTDRLALAVGVAKKAADAFPGTLSDDSVMKLEKFSKTVADLRVGIIDHMSVFMEVNNEHRDDLLKKSKINSTGHRLKTDIIRAHLAPLAHHGLEGYIVEQHYTIPDYIDPMYTLETELNDLSKPDQFPVARTLLPDLSYDDEMPAALMRDNTAVSKNISIKRYFAWYCEHVETGAITSQIDSQVKATEVVDHGDIDQLMFFADYHSDRHTAISDIVNGTNIMVHALYDELAKRWRRAFNNQCAQIVIHKPVVVATYQPIPMQQPAQAAQRAAAQNHDWDIIPSQLRSAQKRENYRNIFLYEISALLAELTAEITRCKNIAASSLPDFFKRALRDKIQCKETKKVSLERLLQSETFDDLARDAAALSTDPVVTEGSKSRTHKLLIEITKKAQPGYQSPRPVS